jgi:translocation and assembly module TamB
VRRLRIIVYALVLLLSLGLYGLLGTTSGFHLLLRTLNAWTSLQVSVTSASGSLLHGLELGQLQIRGDGFSFSSASTSMQLKVLTFLSGKPDLSRLHMDDVDVTLSGSPEVKPGTATEVLPLAVAVDNLRLRRLTITGPGSAHYFLADVRLSLDAGRDSLNWSRLRLDADNLTLQGDGQLQFGPPPRISSTLIWTLRQGDGLPPLAGSTRIKGDTGKLTLRTRLTRPVAATARFTIHDLLGKLRWKGEISLPEFNTAAVSDKLPQLRAGVTLQGHGDLQTLDAQGSLVLSGIKAPGLEITGTAANAELPLRLDLNAHRSAGKSRADLTLAWSESGVRVRTQDIMLTLPKGTMILGLAQDGFKLGADAPIVLNGQQGKMHLQASGDAASINLDAVRIALDGGVINASGAYQRVPGGALQLSADWHDLSLPWRGDSVASPRGELQFNGGLDAYHIDMTAQLHHRNLPAASLQMHARGNRHELNLEPVKLGLLEGIVTGTGRLAWGTDAGLDLRFQGHGINPGRRWPAWPGSLSTEGRLAITPSDGGYNLTLEKVDLHGRLHGQPVSLKLDAVIAPRSVTLNRADLASGDASLKLRGGVDDGRYDLHWDINIPQLTALLPDGAGKVQGRGVLAGTPAQPVLTGSLTAHALRSPWLDAGSIELTTNIDLQKTRALNLDLSAADLAYRSLMLKQLQLQIAGTGSHHDYRLTAENPDGQLQLAGTGSYGDGQWQGRTDQFELLDRQFGTWQLRQPAVTRVSRGKLASEPLCLVHESSSLCLDGSRERTDHWNGQVVMHAMPLGMLRPWFPDFLDVKGNADLRLNARRQGGETGIDADLVLSPGMVLFQLDTDQYQRFSYDSGTIKLTFNQGRLNTDAQVHFTDNATPVKARLQMTGLDHFLAPDPAAIGLKGSISGRVKNLDFIATLTPYITDVHGALGIDMDVKGTLARPVVSGQFHLTDAGFHVPDLGIELEKMSIRGNTTPSGAYEIAGQWQSGKGSVHVKGTLREGAQGEPLLHATLSGKDAEIINLPEAWAVASSALTLDLSPKEDAVSGNVSVSHGMIDLDELKSRTPVSKDVVFVNGKEKPDARRLPPMKTDVTVNFGDDIKLKGQGLKGKFKGKLAIQSDKEYELLGNGELQIVDGTYSAYGQTLKIEEGKLVYQQAPLDNPELRIRAVREVEDVTAGVRVDGFLNNPVVTLFSTPSMKEEEILSYLVFARPLDNLSVGEGTDLISAATNLGLQNSGFITSSIANTFGIDEFKIKSTTDTSGKQQQSVVIGKYLTPKLYLSYGVSLFESLATVKIRYDISKHWSLEAQQGKETGADVLYKIK